MPVWLVLFPFTCPGPAAIREPGAQLTCTPCHSSAASMVSGRAALSRAFGACGTVFSKESVCCVLSCGGVLWWIGVQGWSRPYSFNTGDLVICANVLGACRAAPFPLFSRHGVLLSQLGLSFEGGGCKAAILEAQHRSRLALPHPSLPHSLPPWPPSPLPVSYLNKSPPGVIPWDDLRYIFGEIMVRVCGAVCRCGQHGCVPSHFLFGASLLCGPSLVKRRVPYVLAMTVRLRVVASIHLPCVWR